MIFTNEEFEFLKTIEDKLYVACYCKFVRLSNRTQLEQLDKIYKRVFHSETGAIGACSHCLLEICKKVGNLYFKEKKEMEETENKAVEEEKPKKMSEYSYDSKKAATTKKTAKNNKK